LLTVSKHHYPFGSTMPNRNYQPSVNKYRYGFNGKENDNETVSTGEGTQDYGYRIYNPSLGRFLSVDPLTKDYPWYTPYQFAGNIPIAAIDIDGAEPKFKPIEKYKYGEEIDLKTATANRIMAVPNTATNFVNGVGYMFSLVIYNVEGFLRSPEDYFEEVGDYWSKSTVNDINHIKQRVDDISSDPVGELSAPLKGAQGAENILTIGLQVAIVAKTPIEFSSEINSTETTIISELKNQTTKQTEVTLKLSTREISSIPMNKVYGSVYNRLFKYGYNWQAKSLNGAIKKFADGAQGVFNAAGGKIEYTSPKTGITIVQDVTSEYFRIIDKDGVPLNYDGKIIMGTNETIQAETHFINSDPN